MPSNLFSFGFQDSGVTAGARLGVTGFLSNTRVVLFKNSFPSFENKVRN